MRGYFCRKIKTGDSLFKQRLSPNKLINLIPFFIKNKNNRKTSYILPNSYSRSRSITISVRYVIKSIKCVNIYSTFYILPVSAWTDYGVVLDITSAHYRLSEWTQNRRLLFWGYSKPHSGLHWWPFPWKNGIIPSWPCVQDIPYVYRLVREPVRNTCLCSFLHIIKSRTLSTFTGKEGMIKVEKLRL